jgi:hypothetical protein
MSRLHIVSQLKKDFKQNQSANDMAPSVFDEVFYIPGTVKDLDVSRFSIYTRGQVLKTFKVRKEKTIVIGNTFPSMPKLSSISASPNLQTNRIKAMKSQGIIGKLLNKTNATFDNLTNDKDPKPVQQGFLGKVTSLFGKKTLGTYKTPQP